LRLQEFWFVEAAMNFIRAFCIALAWLPVAAPAHEYQLKSLTIDHPFTRATPPGAKSGGAFFVVQNASATPDKLIGAASPAAGSAEIHQMTMDGGVMKMHVVAAVDIPSGGKLELKPGGYHVMMLGLKQPLKAGDKVPMTLTFQNAGSILVSVDVETMGSTGGTAHKQ
jgi:copper(I)-binding protein